MHWITQLTILYTHNFIVIVHQKAQWKVELNQKMQSLGDKLFWTYSWKWKLNLWIIWVVLNAWCKQDIESPRIDQKIAVHGNILFFYYKPHEYHGANHLKPQILQDRF